MSPASDWLLDVCKHQMSASVWLGQVGKSVFMSTSLAAFWQL